MVLPAQLLPDLVAHAHYEGPPLCPLHEILNRIPRDLRNQDEMIVRLFRIAIQEGFVTESTRLKRTITYGKYDHIEMAKLPEAPFLWEYSPKTGDLYLAIRVYDLRWNYYQTQEFSYRPHPQWLSSPFNQTMGSLSNHPPFRLSCRMTVYDEELVRAFTILLQGKTYSGWEGDIDDGRGLVLAKSNTYS